MSSALRQVVLVGAGHAHLLVARQAQRLARAGARVVLVDPGDFWYSGLATGMLGGMYDPALDRVDPKPLIERYGGEHVRDRLTALDNAQRTATLASGATLRYDTISLNLGSVVDEQRIDHDRENVWTVKPIRNLCKLREQLQASWSSRGAGVRRITVIGSGPTGCEIAANLRALAERHGAAVELRLLLAGARVLESHTASAARCLECALERRKIEIFRGCRITRIEGNIAVAEDGRRFESDVFVLATGLRGPALLRDLGLPVNDRGQLRVEPTLQSVDRQPIFGVGDCASIEGLSLPQVGVFAVRQAPVLLENLLALLQGKPLRPFKPQRRYLIILNLGDGRGLSLRGRLHHLGRIDLWLKDRLDQRFLRKVRV